MKQFFIMILTLLVISYIYSTDLKNSVKIKANTVVKSSSSSKTDTISNKNYKKKIDKKKKKVKIIKIKRKQFKDPIQVLRTGWLKISTTMFRKTDKFPPIELPNGKQIKIKINKKYFRINEAFTLGINDSVLPPGRKYFWFRLSGKHLYYSMTKSDINILGDVTVKNIKTSYKSQESKNEMNCFKIVDREDRNWKLCAETIELRAKWICTIKDILGLIDKTCLNPDQADNTVIVEIKVTQPIILIPLPSPKCNEDWNFNLKGSDWNCECSEGKYLY